MPVNANALELFMLELINEERTSRGLNPFQLEKNLNSAAEDHSEWMLRTNTFSHTGAGGSSATQRIDAAFDLSGNWRTAENIAIQSERGNAGFRDDVADLHTSLMNSPGHRANLLNPNLTYIGIGVEAGDFVYDSGGRFNSVIVTQKFATTQGNVDLDQGPGANPPPVTVSDFTNGNDRVTLSNAATVFALDGNDTVFGSSAGERVHGGAGNDQLHGRGGADRLFGGAGTDRLEGGDGNDALFGNTGNDVLLGQGGNDVLTGGNGNDRLFGNAGVDTLIGGKGNDTLKDADSRGTFYGNKGNDRIEASEAADWIHGGNGNDTIVTGAGNDTVFGGNGFDTFVFNDDFGQDRLRDMGAGDTLRIDDALLSGQTTGAAVVAAFGEFAGGRYVLDFGGGDRVLLDGVADAGVLAESLEIF